MQGKFVVDQKVLLSQLAAMQPICNKRTALQVTESILFQVTPRELTLKATDMEISLQSNLLVESDFEENVSFLIPGKRVFELVKEIDGKITFVLDNSQLRITAKNIDLALNIQDAQDFPPFPERIENLMDFEAAFLLNLLNKVAFLIPQNNANAALNGLLVEINDKALCLVTTDGHCLARVTSDKYTLAEEKKWLLPKRAILELKKLLETSHDTNVFLGTCGQQLVFSGKNFNFFTRLIAEPFPNYEPVLDKKDFIPARVAKASLLKTLKRTNCLLSGQFVSANFAFSPGNLKVNLHNKEVGKLDESIILEDFDGKAIESRFYSPYLLNGLQVFTDERISFHIKNAIKPIIFESDEEGFSLTYLVMPVSLTQN